MEPRPHERGNVESVEVAEEMAACFNGATSSRTWKPVSTGTGISGLTTLQWSHVLTNVETTTARTRSRPYRSASMEPRPHERGNQWLRATTRLPRAASMEPRPHERGNAAVPRVRARQNSASMEPRPHERGNCPVVLLTCSGASGFNGATSSRTWKRGHNSRRLRRNVPASMEPRPHERGNRRRVVGADLCIWASMEPRPHERGNRRAALTPRGREWPLQWSHVLANVETYLSPQLLDVSVSFNGATSSRTWKREGVARI